MNGVAMNGTWSHRAVPSYSVDPLANVTQPFCPFVHQREEHASCSGRHHDPATLMFHSSQSVFNAARFAAALQGRTIVMCGDSIMRQLWTALVCQLWARNLVTAAATDHTNGKGAIPVDTANASRARTRVVPYAVRIGANGFLFFGKIVSLLSFPAYRWITRFLFFSSLLVLLFSSLHLFSSECRPRQDSELVVLSCVQVDHPLLALLFSSLHLFSSECRPSLPFGAPPCLRHGIHASDP